MATLEEQVKELQAQVKQISEDIAKELTNQKIKQIQNGARLESLIRFLIERQGFTFDEYIDFVDAYIKFADKMHNLASVEGIGEKVKQSSEFNSTSVVKIYADDLNVLPIISQTGAISNALLNQLYSLPHTNRFKVEVQRITSAEGSQTN